MRTKLIKFAFILLTFCLMSCSSEVVYDGPTKVIAKEKTIDRSGDPYYYLIVDRSKHEVMVNATLYYKVSVNDVLNIKIEKDFLGTRTIYLSLNKHG